jgi:hypothetical protein
MRTESVSIIQPLLLLRSTLPTLLFWLCRWESKLGHSVCFRLFPRNDIFVPALQQLRGEMHRGPLRGGDGVGDQYAVG